MASSTQMIYDLYVDEDGDIALGIGEQATYVYCQDRGRVEAAEDHYVALGDFHDHWEEAKYREDLWTVENISYSQRARKQFTGTLAQCYNVIDKVKGYL